MLAFLPGAAEIRRTETLLRERVVDPAVDIVALYGALDADVQDRAIAPAPPGRRKVVLATSIAETSLTIDGRAHRDRLRARAGAALRAGCRPHPARNRAGVARRGRPAARPRRPHRARRLLPAVGRAADRVAANPMRSRKSSPPISPRFVLDLAPWGVADPGQLVFLDPPPRRGAQRGAARCSPTSAPSTATAASPTRAGARPAAAAAAARPHGGRCRPRRAQAAHSRAARSPPCSPSAASAATTSICATGSTRCAATARAAREEARAMARRWAESAQADSGRAPGRGSQRDLAARRASSRSPIRTASPRTAARGGALPAGQWARRQYRSGLAAGARAVPRGGRDRRHRRAGPHPACRRDRRSPRSRRSSPIASRARDEITFDAGER